MPDRTAEARRKIGDRRSGPRWHGSTPEQPLEIALPEVAIRSAAAARNGGDKREQSNGHATPTAELVEVAN